MKKRLEGIVVSTKSGDTIVVEVTRRSAHPMYRKIIKRTRKYLVSPNGTTASVGDRVLIEETRPQSKRKNFKLVEALKK